MSHIKELVCYLQLHIRFEVNLKNPIVKKKVAIVVVSIWVKQ
jgi:hypothetical protein